MPEETKHIKFQNRQNPKAGFDLVDLQMLRDQKDLDHDPSELHVVEFYIILLIEGGKGHHTVDFTNYSCERGTLITVRKDQIHKFQINEELKGKLLLFTDEFLVSYLEKLEATKSLQLFNELLGEPKIQLSKSAFEEVSQLVSRIRSEYLDKNDPYSMGIIRSELHILIAKLYRIKSKVGKKVSDKKYVEEFIHLQRLVEENVTKTNQVQDYAQMMGYSRKTLNTITRSVVNKTAKEFVDEICTKQIKRLLINTELAVKEVAYASGFDESTNFYKYFKRQTGSTPEQFREAF